MAEKIYHCTESKSNKRWSFTIQGNDVLVKFGRIGLAGQEKLHSFSNAGARDEFIADKVAEKMKKGYKEINKEKLSEEIETAQDLGTQFKFNRIEWVDKKNKTLSITTNYDPSRFVYVEVLNSWSKEVIRLLLGKNETYKIDGVSESDRIIECASIFASTDSFAGAARRYLQRLSKKVQAVVIIKLAALGVRKLNLDDEDDAEGVSQVTAAPDLNELVNESGASSQVISRFAGLGKRLLNI